MNIYAVRNAHSYGTAHEVTMGGYHSAGIVVVAATLEEARDILRARYLTDESPWAHERRGGDPYDFSVHKEIDGLELVDTSRQAVVLFADGGC